MDFPVEITLGSFKITVHLLFETLAFIIGFRYYLYLRKRTTDRISDDNRIWIIIGAAFGAFLFSRLVGALESPEEWWISPNRLLYFFSAKTIVGGLFGGLLGVELMKRSIGEKSSSGDLFTFPLILAMMIGRIGCFTMGVHEQTYGVETALPWGLNLGDGILRHPVSLYEFIFLGFLWISLKKLMTVYSFKKGNLFKLFFIAYAVFRLLLDFIKPGYRMQTGLGFSLGSIQITCILILMYYAKPIYFLIFNRKELMSNDTT